MSKRKKHPLNTRKGILAAAAEIRERIAAPDFKDHPRARWQYGPFSLMDYGPALLQAACLLESKANQGGGFRESQAVDLREAVSYYGSEVKAVEALSRQLAAQGEYMEGKERERAEKALAKLEQGHTLRDEGDGKFRIIGDISPRYLGPAIGCGRIYLLDAHQVELLQKKGFILTL